MDNTNRCWIVLKYPTYTDKEGNEKKMYDVEGATVIEVHSMLPSAVIAARKLGLDCDKEVMRGLLFDTVQPKHGSSVSVVFYNKSGMCPYVYRSCSMAKEEFERNGYFLANCVEYVM